MKLYKRLCTLAFLILEGILYCLILTSSGDMLVNCCFTSVILTFVYAVAMQGRPLLIAALACTVGADYFLVTFVPSRQLPGMAFFLVAQGLYAFFLHRQGFSRIWLMIRLIATALIIVIALVVLKGNVDALALISVLYYANLILNAVMAFGKFRRFPLLALGFLFFILCDTVIGLQVASGGYLPIAPDSALYEFLWMPVNLVWLFYLPSQVLIALSSATQKRK